MVLKNYLTLDRSKTGEAAYSDTAVDLVIDVCKQTIAFAGLSEHEYISEIRYRGRHRPH